MTAIASGLGDIPWPAGLQDLLTICRGFVNVDLGVMLDVGCAVGGLGQYFWFFLYAYGPLLLATAL